MAKDSIPLQGGRRNFVGGKGSRSKRIGGRAVHGGRRSKKEYHKSPGERGNRKWLCDTGLFCVSLTRSRHDPLPVGGKEGFVSAAS